MHEIGHALIILPEDYLNINYGKVFSEQGWYISQDYFHNDFGPRIDIWTSPPPDGFVSMKDIPEQSPLMRIENDMGPRYYNIMGSANYPYVWTGASTYNAFLNKLSDRLFSDGYFTN